LAQQAPGLDEQMALFDAALPIGIEHPGIQGVHFGGQNVKFIGHNILRCSVST
jgi:hypothetical protein